MAPPTSESVRTEVRSWLEEAWDPGLALIEWRERLADSGWGCPTWPTRWYGRDLPPALAPVVDEEMRRVRAVGPAAGVGMALAAPTILEHGSDDLKGRHLRPTITGGVTWCQLFSEPGAGSDLAGLTTRAEADGDEWVVTGQKVWNTGAHRADYGLLVARTNWDVPKHRGITYFVLDMRQPGVEVRPLRQANGHASFNEVFLTEARVAAGDVVGEVGDGWKVALATLAHERRLALFGRQRPLAADAGRAVREAAAEAADASEPHKWYPQRAGRVDMVPERAHATGADADPVVRQEVAALMAMNRAAGWTAQRAQAARQLGRPPGAEGSIGKLSSSNIARAAAH
ncbi:MAG TPA: acyl-CoA dehydrogenase family protein, partial [Acidimicrobiales bacterium]|nr:acyl-CoA dehydrogenase family protein [Acidimicrobiales bacterium]